MIKLTPELHLFTPAPGGLATRNSDPNLLNLSECTSAALATGLLSEGRQRHERYEPTLGGVREDFHPEQVGGPRKPTSLLSLRERARGIVSSTSTKFQTVPRNARISEHYPGHLQAHPVHGQGPAGHFTARSEGHGRERRGGLLGLFRRR